MIIKTFDNGWGPEYPAKQFEQLLVSGLLKDIVNDEVNTVMINSVWYTNDYHQKVLTYLNNSGAQRIILVAMIDASIPKPDWYSGIEIVTAGYYPGKYELDYWALVADKYFSKPTELFPAEAIDVAYMCLNRKPHWHRQRLYRKLEELNLLDSGLVSMGSDSGPAPRTIANDVQHDDLAPNASSLHHGIPNDLITLGNLQNWQRCFVNVVTETVFDVEQSYFVSEKIYKPILGFKPFFVFAPNGANNWLSTRGFESYVDDFNDITDLNPAIPEQLPQVILALSQQAQTYWKKKYVDFREKILYNRNQFDVYVQQQWNKIN